MDSDATTLERDLVCQFMKAVHDCDFTTCDSLSDNALRLFDSVPGRFIQIGESGNVTVIDEKDSVDSCYYVNPRYCDIVLSEIADFLNMKGVEQTFDFAESKEIMIRVSGYILDEVKNLQTSLSGNCPMYLFFDGENLYFLNNENHIACLNVLTGEYDESTYTIELESAENSYMTLSGTQLIYRVETSGSGYVTKSVDITNLRKSPVTVNYSPADVISIPDFRF